MYICTYIHIYIYHICIHVCTYARNISICSMYLYIHIHMWLHRLHICTHIFIEGEISLSIYRQVYIYMILYIKMYIHMQMHIPSTVCPLPTFFAHLSSFRPSRAEGRRTSTCVPNLPSKRFK